ncbi:DoxX family protein [Enhygromyxa salina]|uniref:DoxX n=1 Tax=Enhygromyxa salina TaxID=215803 RepID=A0A2S9YP14_9BACT|nr:hypothetical protein [Enhygromyxa salina]PRQ06818.1 hypothetical protein ENSA7_34780 [Enhygromyxa salina]
MSAQKRQVKAVFRGLLGAVMVLVGLMHFVNPEPFIMIVPDYLPYHAALVYISGVFEILLGVALFVPQVRSLAGWGLIALFLAVLPANIWMATQGIQLPGLEVSPAVAWARLPFQAVFIVWAWAVTRPDADPNEASPDRE